MKKILSVLCVSMLTSTVALADSIQWIINGSPGGSFHKRGTLYIESLRAQGWEVEVKDLKKNAQGVEFFKTTDQPSAMVTIANATAKLGYDQTLDNFVSAEYVEGLFLCTTADAMEKDTVTIGATKGYNIDSFIAYLESQDKKVVRLPYENSGHTLQGIMGGDVTAMVANQKTAVKWMKDGNTCIFNSSEEESLGIPSYKQFSDLDFPINAASVLATNVDFDKLRVAVKQAQKEGALSDWLESVNLKAVDGLSREQELELVNRAVAGWK